ncbi:MAG: hypothetical protein P9M03_12895, partial [Candidatus Theseobacter exili]|nr:hypothetical protein [Candidatus Theseobacter exili]
MDRIYKFITAQKELQEKASILDQMNVLFFSFALYLLCHTWQQEDLFGQGFCQPHVLKQEHHPQILPIYLF